MSCLLCVKMVGSKCCWWLTTLVHFNSIMQLFTLLSAAKLKTKCPQFMVTIFFRSAFDSNSMFFLHSCSVLITGFSDLKIFPPSSVHEQEYQHEQEAGKIRTPAKKRDKEDKLVKHMCFISWHITISRDVLSVFTVIHLVFHIFIVTLHLPTGCMCVCQCDYCKIYCRYVLRWWDPERVWWDR